MKKGFAALLLACATSAVYGAEVEPIASCRLLDTRPGSPLSASTVLNVDVRGECGIPENALGVVFNLTVVDPAGTGYVKVYGTSSAPNTAVITYNTGEDVITSGASVWLSTDDENTSTYDPPSWGVKVLSSQTADIVIDATAYLTRKATTFFKGVVTDKEDGLGPTWEALELDTLNFPLSLICQEPWTDPANCGNVAITDEVCGTGHIGTLGSSPNSEIFVHTITDCQ